MKLKDFGYAILGVLISKKISKEELQILQKRQENYRAAKEERLKTAKVQGVALSNDKATELRRTERCNHRKGGNVAFGPGSNPVYKGYLTGYGDSTYFAVTKHTYANGDTHVQCLRCGKKWKPSDKDRESYIKALDFPTLNVSSTSIQFDGGSNYKDHRAFIERHRELTKNS